MKAYQLKYMSEATNSEDLIKTEPKWMINVDELDVEVMWADIEATGVQDTMVADRGVVVPNGTVSMGESQIPFYSQTP